MANIKITSIYIRRVLIFCENTKIATSCWTTMDRRMLEPTKKKIPHNQGQRRSHNKVARGTQLHLKSNLIPTRDPWWAQAKPCVPQGRGKGAVTPTRDWARPTFECLRVFCGDVNQQWPAMGTEALATAVLGGMANSLLKETAINPTIWLPSRQLTNWRTKFSHCCKSSRPRNRLPNLGSPFPIKGTEYPQGIWLWRSAGFDYRTSKGLGKQTLGVHKQNLVHTKTQEKGAVTPKEDWARLVCVCLGVSGRGASWQWPTTGSGYWLQ